MSTGDGSWVWQSPLPQGERINDVYISGAGHVLAVGDHGLLLRSDDGGLTWYRQPLGIRDDLFAVAFATPSTGVIVGAHGRVLRTTDGGATWAASQPTSASLLAACFVDDTHGWAVGTAGTVLHTTDAGATWTVRTTPTTRALFGVTFADRLRGWAVGHDGTVIATVSGGDVWTTQKSGTTRDLHDVCRGTSGLWTDVWAVGTQTILRTTDGGLTWLPVTRPPGHDHVTWTAVEAPWAGQVVVAAANDDYNWNQTGGVWLTGDGGATWTTAWEHRFATLTCLGRDAAGTVMWAGGRGGLLVRGTSMPPMTWTVMAGAPLPMLESIARAGDTLWAVGSRTLMRRDGDGWQPCTTVTLGKWAQAVVFADATRGWVADGSRLWGTTDGGTTWTSLAILPIVIDSLDFASAHVGVAVGYSAGPPAGGRLLRTLDGGRTWTDVTPASTPPALTAVDMVSATHGYAVGEFGTVLRTTDGSNWTALTSGVADRLTDVCFVDASTGWIASSAGQVLATTDAGGSFTSTRVSDKWLSALHFSGTEHGWAVGVSGTVFRYDGATRSWAAVSSGTGLSLTDVVFADTLRGWVVGTDGAVLATTTSGVPDILPPVTTVSGVPTGWRNRDVVLAFSATDPGGSGVVATRYRIDDGAWAEGTTCTVTAPADHSNDGTHTVAFCSVDAFGNEEAAQTCTVSIDTRKPRPRAPYPVTVDRGRTATLRYRVNDTLPCAGTARPVIKVRTLGGRLVKTFKPAAQPVNTWLKLRFVCKLARGKYRISVSAIDAAGNRQARVATTTLTVR